VWHEVCWNDENETHIARHGVAPNEVHQVLGSNPPVYRSGRQNTRLVLGTTDTGRHLVVVLADALDGRDYVVTARDTAPEEKATFRRKARS
jgi:uncharacterized DUF497 family protein